MTQLGAHHVRGNRKCAVIISPNTFIGHYGENGHGT
jgi:hypothetical protein